MNIGVYPGSFDPITRGHVNIIERALRFCDQLIVVIGINKAKKTLFDIDTRLGFIHSSTRDVQGSIVIDCTEKLITDYAKSQEARLLIRGVRSSKDFEYETTLAQCGVQVSRVCSDKLSSSKQFKRSRSQSVTDPTNRVFCFLCRCFAYVNLSINCSSSPNGF